MNRFFALFVSRHASLILLMVLSWPYEIGLYGRTAAAATVVTGAGGGNEARNKTEDDGVDPVDYV